MVKKAAMFGLDARIALAIFGALSVISGAALYSAIQSAKAEQYRQYFVEIEKALDHYYLDNYQQVVQFNNTTINIGNLISNYESISSWNGPYIDGSLSNAASIKNKLTSSISSSVYFSAQVLKDDRTTCTVGDSDCYEYINLMYPGSNADIVSKIKNIFDTLDLLVDSGDGTGSGRLQYSTGVKTYISFKSKQRKSVK
tara:strand:+ start:3186 stop:3779 length:594 start_codon:yes stop_codon:yes gene_type:complete